MDHALIWTERASDDIAAIVRYIAQSDPTAAARIGYGIPLVRKLPLGNALVCEAPASSAVPAPNTPLTPHRCPPILRSLRTFPAVIKRTPPTSLSVGHVPGFLLVPKLHLGTPLSAKLYFVCRSRRPPR